MAPVCGVVVVSAAWNVFSGKEVVLLAVVCRIVLRRLRPPGPAIGTACHGRPRLVFGSTILWIEAVGGAAHKWTYIKPKQDFKKQQVALPQQQSVECGKCVLAALCGKWP